MIRRYGFILYALLILLITGPACSLTARLAENKEPAPARHRRLVVLPPAPATPVPGLSELSLPEPAPRRPTDTPTPDNFLARLAELLSAPTSTPTRPLRLAVLPTIPPTPTATATPTTTPTPTDTPPPTFTPLPTNTPIPAPTFTPLPPPPTATPVPPQAPPPAPAVNAAAFTSPVSTPADASGQTQSPAVAAADAGYDFLLAEFFNSPTTNPFMVIYVAIVDANEIPIGDMKIVGTRLDHNLTYESPLSTWHYEGYSAPGEVIKSGNVKFEPPGGIETTSWVLHLEDASGRRMSEDVPFDADQNNKQWYFIKFKRKF